MESAADSGVGNEREPNFETEMKNAGESGQNEVVLEEEIKKGERTPEQNDRQIDNSIFNTISKIVNPPAKVCYSIVTFYSVYLLYNFYYFTIFPLFFLYCKFTTNSILV